MAKIVSNEASLVLNDGKSTIPRGRFSISVVNDKVLVKSGTITWRLDYGDTEVDGVVYPSAKELAAELSNFKSGGGDYRDWETDRKITRLNSSHRL